MAAPQTLDAFNLTDVTYKTVNGHVVQATILIPKSIENKPGKYPLTVRWHGGFLVTGHRLFPDWWPKFTRDFYLQQHAITISVDHRLMPEAKGVDILQDLKDFYAWLQKPGELQSHLPTGMEVDTTKLLVTGESAGGYLGLQSAILFPDIIKAAIIFYPMIDLRAPHYTQAYHKDMFDPPIPQFPIKMLDDHVASLKGDEVITGAINPFVRIAYAAIMVQQGLTEKFLGTERELYPLEVLEDGKMPENLPPIWFVHGKQDSAVPIEGTHVFLEKLREKMPKVELHTSFPDGDHGFDNHLPGTGKPATREDQEWVREGLEFVEKYWPA